MGKSKGDQLFEAALKTANAVVSGATDSAIDVLDKLTGSSKSDSYEVTIGGQKTTVDIKKK